jgi:hypothetical protein
MKTKSWLLCVAASALLQSAFVHASSTEKVVNAETKDEFTAVAVEVHKQLQPGGRFEFATVKERADIDANLGEMQSLYDKFGTVSAMDQGAKLKLFNDQEAINATLTRRDDKRLVCEHVAPLGSNIPRTTCRTYGDIAREQRDTQHLLDQTRQVQNTRGGGG